jgi:hypothetical protein
MPYPNTSYTASRDQYPCLPQLIRYPRLSIGRILIGHVYHGLFHLRSNSVLDTGLPTTLLPKPFKTMLVIGFLNVIEMLSGNAVDLTGLRNVLQILS